MLTPPMSEALIVFTSSVLGLTALTLPGDGGDGFSHVTCGGGGPGCSLSVGERATVPGGQRRQAPDRGGTPDRGGDGAAGLALQLATDQAMCAAMGPLAGACMAIQTAGLFAGGTAGNGGDGGGPAVTVSPVVVARRAAARLRLPSPEIKFSPAGEQLVGLPTWLWIDRATWNSRSATAAVPGVSVTAQARPRRVVWELGDGSRVTCHGPGTAWRSGMAAGSASPTCGHTYRTASGNQPDGAYRVTATVSWAITWSGTGGGGTLPAMSTSGSARLRVAESQALNGRISHTAPDSR